MALNSFNSNPMKAPIRKTVINNGSIGGRREITDIKKEMLDTTRPELKRSYIAKYSREDNNSDLPISNNQDSTTIQRNKIEGMRNLHKGL